MLASNRIALAKGTKKNGNGSNNADDDGKKNWFQCIQKQRRRSLCVSCLNFMRDLISVHCAIVRFHLGLSVSPSIQWISTEHVLSFSHFMTMLPFTLGDFAALCARMQVRMNESE